MGNIEGQDTIVPSRFKVFESIDCPNLNRSFGKWYTAVPPLVRCTTGLGPADYFGRTMISNVSENIRIGVVDVAIAGCKIELFAKSGFSGAGANSPIPAKYKGSAYAWLLDIAKRAQEDGVIKGILMHQGESNVGQIDWPEKVKDVYENLIKDLSLDASKTPLLVGEMLYTNQGGACGSHNIIIAQLPQLIPNTHIISASGLQGQDKYHFSTSSYRSLGERYAKKMLTLLPKTMVKQ